MFSPAYLTLAQLIFHVELCIYISFIYYQRKFKWTMHGAHTKRERALLEKEIKICSSNRHRNNGRDNTNAINKNKKEKKAQEKHRQKAFGSDEKKGKTEFCKQNRHANLCDCVHVYVHVYCLCSADPLNQPKAQDAKVAKWVSDDSEQFK